MMGYPVLGAMPTFLLIVLVMSLASTTTSAPPENTCLATGIKCQESKVCCSGCCHENNCNISPEPCASAASNPCFFHTCPPGKVCYMAEVNCLQSPCERIPACKPDNSDYDYA